MINMNESKKNSIVKKNSKLKNDIILIVSLLLFSLLIFMLFSYLKKPGALVIVTVNDEIYGSYSLSENASYNIETEYGSNKLVIKDGKAYIDKADCENQICVNSSPINKTGESIICLPHKLVIYIDGNEDNKSFDIK